MIAYPWAESRGEIQVKVREQRNSNVKHSESVVERNKFNTGHCEQGAKMALNWSPEW